MDENSVRQIVKDLPVGSQLTLTYRKDVYTSVVGHLLGMVNVGMVSINNPNEMAMIMYLLDSKKWGRGKNYEFHIFTTTIFDVDWFVERLAYSLESLKVV